MDLFKTRVRHARGGATVFLFKKWCVMRNVRPRKGEDLERDGTNLRAGGPRTTVQSTSCYATIKDCLLFPSIYLGGKTGSGRGIRKMGTLVRRKCWSLGR